ncbi:MAG: hypothetical protein ABIJ09_02980 [Pseudomonadota bacterium]
MGTLKHLSCVALLLVVINGCNEHTFRRVFPVTTRVVAPAKKIDIDRAADILFVVDNSGSMAEEQENLAKNASSSSAFAPPNDCDASGFLTLQRHVEDHPEQSQEDWPQDIQAAFAECGFIERLMLFNNHFHIGIITTDMHDCDNNFGGAPRPSTPQRGCLQTSAADPTLKVLTWETADLANKFASIIQNIGTAGSPFEMGLMATEHFLTPQGVVAPRSASPGTCGLERDCSGDLEAFLRDNEVNAAGDLVETKLVIIYLTDEEDCSNVNAIDESQQGTTSLCYTQPGLLTDTQHYARFLQTRKSSADLVAVGLIAGLFDTGSGFEPSGCQVTSTGPSEQCDESWGRSIETCTTCVNGNPACTCHPYIPASDCQGVEQPATNCCQADSANRYFRVATQMNSFKVDTLCSDSYKDTMIAIANLINETGVIVLPEVPPQPSMLVVKMRGPRWSDGEWHNVPRYDETTGQPPEGGFALIDENTRIKFFGQWVPQPGDEIQVMFLGE